jgi:hypothetical protein
VDELQENKMQEEESPIVEAPSQEEQTPWEPASTRTRIFALIGALFMVILVLLYTYSLATGKIFTW